MSDLLSVLSDLHLERLVLGEVLSYGLASEFADAGLVPEHFFREEHALVWRAAVDVAEAGGKSDTPTVYARLKQQGHIERVGLAYFSSFEDGVPRPAPPNITIQIDRLEELTAARLTHYAALQVDEQLKRPGAVADGVIVQHLDAVQQILERKRTQAAPWLDVHAQWTAHERDIHEASTGLRVGLGLEVLDGIIGGIRAGEVLGLMGRPGIGKTVFLSHIATACARAGFGQVFFSLEMPGSQIVGRLKQMLYGISRYQLEQDTKRGTSDEGLYLRTFDRLVIVDTPSLSVSEMSRRVRQIQRGPLRDVPVGLIVIDHLGLIGGDRSLATYDRVSVQAREIKELAKRLGCAVVLAVQVNREAGGDGSRELGLGSARDSGVVEEAMDYMVGIRRMDRSLTLSPFERDRFKDVIFAKVIKNRHGSPGEAETAYRFNPVGLRLDEDRSMAVEGEDVAARIAQMAGRGGRR